MSYNQKKERHLNGTVLETLTKPRFVARCLGFPLAHTATVCSSLMRTTLSTPTRRARTVTSS